MTGHRLGQGMALVGLLAGAAVILLPFVWMISLALKPADEIFSPGIDLLPSRVAWQNFVEAFTRVDLARYLLNGVVVCAGILVFQLIFAVPCAFALAQRRFRSRTCLAGSTWSRSARSATWCRSPGSTAPSWPRD